MNIRNYGSALAVFVVWFATHSLSACAQTNDSNDSIGQPLSQNVRRVIDALELLGRPLASSILSDLQPALKAEDSDRMQAILDQHVLCTVAVNPESRAKVERGPAAAVVQQAGYTPFLIKILNQGAIKSGLRLNSPQAGSPFGGMAPLSMQRQEHPMQSGFWCGDHHIHGAGCAHYTTPTEGVTPQDMFRQVAGEGLNVGCILTWGPCFEFQRQFFNAAINDVSEPKTLLKYDLEVSGFGSQALGHVCLLNLRDQNYPGSDGSKTKGWPTWATPVLRWAKSQGAVTGFAHSASGLQIDPKAAATRLLNEYDRDQSGQLSKLEIREALLTEAFEQIDVDRDQHLTLTELQVSIDRVADSIPNLAVPEMNSVGAMELPVAVVAGVCDFISAMDTARVPEWNMWYHLLNCGFPLKVSGETDFPCMSSTAVGQGRTYVHLGDLDRLDFGDWCRGLAAGRSYVSDGYAHALQFSVNERSAGDTLRIPAPGKVNVTASLVFAPETPLSVAYGTLAPEGGRRFVGDTVTLHGSQLESTVRGGDRLVEVIVNGQVVASKSLPADGHTHEVSFDVAIAQSSWLALRTFPQLHTNPVEILVDNAPIRVSQSSARWCEETIHQLWRMRQKNIAVAERTAAQQMFDEAIQEFRRRAKEARGP